MKHLILFLLLFFLSILYLQNSYSQDESDYYMTMEEWQKRMDEATLRKNEATSKLYLFKIEKDSLLKENSNLKTELRQIDLEIYKILDIDTNELYEFKNRFETTERKILDVSAPLSDIKEYWFNWISKNKIRLLYKYRSRYRVMKEKLDNWKGE